MTPISRQRGAFMADYRNFTYGGVTFVSGPAGWRDWCKYLPLIGQRLRRWPFFSGSRKKFYIRATLPKGSTVKKIGLLGDWIGPFQETIDTYDSRPEMTSQTMQGDPPYFDLPTTFWPNTPWLGGVGQHRFDATFICDGRVMGRETFVNFDLKSSDTLFLAILAIVVTIFIGIWGPFFGAWLGKTVFRQDFPNPIVVVIATPTPTPMPTFTPTPTITPLPASQ